MVLFAGSAKVGECGRVFAAPEETDATWCMGPECVVGETSVIAKRPPPVPF